MGHSEAMIADAVHSLSDLFSDAVTLWSVRLSRLPPDDDHPYGHGRYRGLIGTYTFRGNKLFWKYSKAFVCVFAMYTEACVCVFRVHRDVCVRLAFTDAAFM